MDRIPGASKDLICWQKLLKTCFFPIKKTAVRFSSWLSEYQPICFHRRGSFHRVMVCLLSLPDALQRVASAPENVLGRRGGLLHGGIDCHLHVPVQKCVWAVQTDNGHVRRRVSISTATRLCWWQKWDTLRIDILLMLYITICEFTVLGTWVWNGTTRWSCLHVFCFLLPSYWPVSSSCTTSTQTSWLSLTLTACLWDRPPGEAAHVFGPLSSGRVSLSILPQPCS